tara:strand:+ start:5020 stop:5553 length:534 start_codon:yes stop_codon:yes gene_type:complete
MAWSFIGGGDTGRPFAASGTSSTVFPGGPFAVGSGAHLGLGIAGVSNGATSIVPEIAFPELNLKEEERVARGGTFGQWKPGEPLAWHNEAYEDFTGLVNEDTGEITPSGTRITNYPPLSHDEKSRHDTNSVLKRLKAKYPKDNITYGATQTGGTQAFVSPSGGSQVVFPGQSSSGVV